LLRRKGKQMRPMFVFLTAKLTGTVSERTFLAASFIELLHTATLVHDDVVDEAYQRRGSFSINALWSSKIAVLIGDYFLAKGLILSVEHQAFDLLKIVSVAVKEMSEGELLQIEKSKLLDITEVSYFEIIRKKTAALIAACSSAGAQSAGASDEIVEKMRLFGEYVGLAFQIRDDIFDYQKKGITGKPTGNDLKEKKITLPLIFVLNNSSFIERQKILHTVKFRNGNSREIERLMQTVIENGGLDYAKRKMLEMKEKALDIIREFPDSPARSGLIELVNYTTDREL
jgi:octaprenyl-diphosphate synthase